MNNHISTLALVSAALATHAALAAPAMPKMPPASAGMPTVMVRAPRFLPTASGLGLSGGVRVRMPKETVSGDSVIFNAKAHTMTFLGNVLVKADRGETVRAQRLVLRVPSGTFFVPGPSAGVPSR